MCVFLVIFWQLLVFLASVFFSHSMPAIPQRLQNPKWPTGSPKMADGVWKGILP